jgi:hypothetical protein
MSSSLRRELAIGVFWALAVRSKQTAVVVLAPVLAGYDVFLTRDRSRMLWRFLFCGVILLPVFFYLQVTTHGGFLQNIIGGNLIRTTFAWWLMVAARVKSFWLLCLVVVLLGGFRKSATTIWFVASLAFGLPVIAKRGADMMYFFDTTAALAVLATGVVIRLPRIRRPLLAAAALAMAILQMTWNDRHWLVRTESTANYPSMMSWLSSYVSGKGPIISDDAAIPVALGQSPIWDDPFVLTEWARLGAWSDDALVAGVQKGKYAAVVVSAGDLLWPPDLRAEIGRCYTFVKVFPSTAPRRRNRPGPPPLVFLRPTLLLGLESRCILGAI